MFYSWQNDLSIKLHRDSPPVTPEHDQMDEWEHSHLQCLDMTGTDERRSSHSRSGLLVVLPLKETILFLSLCLEH